MYKSDSNQVQHGPGLINLLSKPFGFDQNSSLVIIVLQIIVDVSRTNFNCCKIGFGPLLILVQNTKLLVQ